MQNLIDKGLAWKMEGAIGRSAQMFLESGACMLPTKRMRDYYGNVIPSRYDVKQGTKGSYQNSVRFFEQNEW
jgi:hypothetical protein